MLTKVTVTGADDSLHPRELVRLQKRFPFAEFGILISGKNFGKNRFPSEEWLKKLGDQSKYNKLNLSCHLCGDYVDTILYGETIPYIEDNGLLNIFQRIQINTHGFKHNFHSSNLIDTMHIFSAKEFIFQYDNKNEHILEGLKSHVDNISVLHDLSHGAGVLPKEWPDSIPGIATGFAGGLSCANVVEELEKIQMIASGDFWIDAETHLRTDDNQYFSIKKVTEFLERTEPYVKRSKPLP